MNELHIKYKSETGKHATSDNPSFEAIPSDHLTEDIQNSTSDRMAVRLIEHEIEHNPKYVIEVDEIDNYELPTPEYVQWLEDKINSLLNG